MPAFRLSFISALIALFALTAVAQHTTTQDIGQGRKLVLHYNAADQITETDTLGPKGELLEKDLLEYKPNYYGAQSNKTGYWPNGKPHRATQDAYDENGNFLGQFIQVYDESGKQIAGHRLTHDPMSNVYHCEEWNVDAQKYIVRECPGGEESEGTPETVKQFTQQEVEQQLHRARTAAERPVATPTVPSGPKDAISMREVGLILPSHIRPGDRVSGSVVENPADYENNPQLIVTRFALPFTAGGKTANLAGWSAEISGEPPQPANGPIALTIPPGQVALAVLFRAAENAGAPVSKAVQIPRVPRDKSKAAEAWLAPAMCLKGHVCMVHGVFSGNSKNTFAAFSDYRANILAETTSAVYLGVPSTPTPGLRPLVIAEGSKAIVFPVIVGELTLQPATRTFAKPEQLLMNVMLEGPEEIPGPEWQPGSFPPSNVEVARTMIPGYKLPKQDKEAEERREKAAKSGGAAGKEEDEGSGEVLLGVKVATADAITFRGAKNGMYVFHLGSNSFKMGAFKYGFVVDATKPGSFTVQAQVIPMLAPIKGQEFTVSAAK
jgi:hypothetical protein